MTDFSKSKSFEDILAWQNAHNFVLSVYRVTKTFPKEEIFGLTSQLKRASISIPANIAEGYKKKGIKDKLRFLNIAQGSLEECRYYLILAKDLEFVSLEEYNNLISQLSSTSYMLNAYCSGIIKNQQE